MKADGSGAVPARARGYSPLTPAHTHLLTQNTIIPPLPQAKAQATYAASDAGAWTEDVGPFKAGVMTFGSTPAAYYNLIGDEYAASLGITWTRASAVSQERLLTRFNETSNPPSPPNVLQSRGPDGDSIYMSMNAVKGGLVGGVSFYYVRGWRGGAFFIFEATPSTSRAPCFFHHQKKTTTGLQPVGRRQYHSVRAQPAAGAR